MSNILVLQLGIPGGPELLIIVFIAVLLFGANKLPALARSGGEAIGEFKRGKMELENEIKSGVDGSVPESAKSSSGSDSDAPDPTVPSSEKVPDAGSD
jgi:sec-independent protein translocase protein TatA